MPNRMPTPVNPPHRDAAYAPFPKLFVRGLSLVVLSSLLAMPAPTLTAFEGIPTPAQTTTPDGTRIASLGTPLGPPAPALRLTAVVGTLERNDSLVRSLAAQQVPPATIDLVVQELRHVVDFRSARPGDAYTLLRAPDGRVVDFRYRAVSGEVYRLYLDAERYVTERRDVELTRRTTRIAGVVASSLYDAIRDLGETPQLASDFADIFAWDVDFARAIQRGDEFQVLYERLYRSEPDGRETYLRPGRILAARYSGASGDHTAVYFEAEEGRGEYYRPDGVPMKRQFLAAPLQYSRVSSAFTNARFHPILKISRPHHGIDYAAPTGTPLWSVADGRVIFRGRSSGFGNLVKVQHANGYVSYYGHLSRFASGLRLGQAVRQKQVIGYVGQTGLATGPHVCFRITKDGRFVNPAALRPQARSLFAAAGNGEFGAARDALLSELRASPVVAVGEAL